MGYTQVHAAQRTRTLRKTNKILSRYCLKAYVTKQKASESMTQTTIVNVKGSTSSDTLINKKTGLVVINST